MCFGTFDFVHKGHEYYLKESKKLADQMVVVIALDETVKQVKGLYPHNDQLARLNSVKKLGIAEEVIFGHPGDKWKVIEEERPDIIALGYDQLAFTDHLSSGLKKRNLVIEVKRMSSLKPDLYKSSKIKKQLMQG